MSCLLREVCRPSGPTKNGQTSSLFAGNKPLAREVEGRKENDIRYVSIGKKQEAPESRGLLVLDHRTGSKSACSGGGDWRKVVVAWSLVAEQRYGGSSWWEGR